MPRPAFRDLLGSRVLVLDGGMGTSTYNYSLTVEGDYAGCENCTDILTRTRPELVEEIHRSFFEVGESGSLTYGSSEQRSPGFTWLTFSPTATTSNPSSWPGVRG